MLGQLPQIAPTRAWHLQTINSLAVLAQVRGGLGLGAECLRELKAYILPLRKLEGPTLLENTSTKSSCHLAEHQHFSGIVVAFSLLCLLVLITTKQSTYNCPTFQTGKLRLKDEKSHSWRPQCKRKRLLKCNCTNQGSSKLDELRSYLGILLKCSVWRSGTGPEILHSHWAPIEDSLLSCGPHIGSKGVGYLF